MGFDSLQQPELTSSISNMVLCAHEIGHNSVLKDIASWGLLDCTKMYIPHESLNRFWLSFFVKRHNLSYGIMNILMSNYERFSYLSYPFSQDLDMFSDHHYQIFFPQKCKIIPRVNMLPKSSNFPLLKKYVNFFPIFSHRKLKIFNSLHNIAQRKVANFEMFWMSLCKIVKTNKWMWK